MDGTLCFKVSAWMAGLDICSSRALLGLDLCCGFVWGEASALRRGISSLLWAVSSPVPFPSIVICLNQGSSLPSLQIPTPNHHNTKRSTLSSTSHLISGSIPCLLFPHHNYRSSSCPLVAGANSHSRFRRENADSDGC